MTFSALALAVALATPALSVIPEASEPVEVRAFVELAQGQASARVMLGDEFELVLEIERPEGTQVFVPRRPDLESFRLLAYTPPEAGKQGGGTERHRYRLMALRMGPKRVPPVEITYRLRDGTSGALMSPKVKVMVVGRLVNEQEPSLAPAPEPVQIYATNWGLVWLLSVLAAGVFATLMTLLFLRLLRDRLIAAAAAPPSLPPNELALQKLEALAVQAIDPSERYASAIDVLREYVGGRYRFDGLESTTAELMDSLSQCDLAEASTASIRLIVEEADLVKFARLTPADQEAHEVIDQVRRVVLDTWAEPDPEEIDQESPQLEAASRGERLRGGALDVIVFGVPSVLVFVGLWVGGHIHLGWIGIALFCVLMFGRDLLGVSPGKKLLGLRLANRDLAQDEPPQGRRLRRNLLLLIAPIGLPIEALILAYNPVAERLGDRWAKTDVVRRPGSRKGQEGSL